MSNQNTGKQTVFLNKSMGTNMLFNYSFRGIGILLGLVYTRLVLTYLGHSLYGMWSTISSIASWINYGDFGIGNGLRNQLAAAVAEEDDTKQKQLIITAGYTLSKLAVGLFLLLLFITELMFFTDIMDVSVRIPMHITNAFFCIDLFLGVARSCAYGFQMSWLSSLAQTMALFSRVVCVWLLITSKSSASLVLFSVLSGVCSVLGNVLIILFLLKKINIKWEKGKNLRNYYRPEYRKNISSLGLQFFIMQIACLILYSTDNVIINKFFSSEAVTEYSLITKVYTTGEDLFSIILISLWSAVTYAMTREDYIWIKKTIRKVLLLWTVFSCGVVLVSIGLNDIMRIWLGKSTVRFDESIVLLFALYTITTTFGSIFVNVTNGLGRLKLQMYFAIAEAILNIPLSIFFAVNCGMGIFGVKLATWICCTSSFAVIPIDVIRYLGTKK